MKNSEFIAGNTYVYSESNISDKYILRADGPSKSSSYIQIYTGSRTPNGHYNYSSNFVISDKFELATQEQVVWLNACIQAGKFIPLENVKPPEPTINNDYSVF